MVEHATVLTTLLMQLFKPLNATGVNMHQVLMLTETVTLKGLTSLCCRRDVWSLTGITLATYAP